MSRLFLGVPLLAALVGGCSPSAPRMHPPDRVDAFCGDRTPVSTAVESIVTSAVDDPEPVAIPSSARITASVKAAGGVIGHWDDQPLHLPHIAQAHGADGEYVTIGDVAIANVVPGSGTSRRIYLTFKAGGKRETLALRSYDMQDVCNEGTRSP